MHSMAMHAEMLTTKNHAEYTQLQGVGESCIHESCIHVYVRQNSIN